MTDNHDELRHLAGAWVLGGLDAADRVRFAAHLEACARCRAEVEASAALPGLLRRVPQEAWQAGPVPADPTPARLLQALSQRRRRERRRAAGLGMAAATAALVGGVVLGAAVDRDGAQNAPAPASVLALSPVAGQRTSGSARLEARPWGTQIALELHGLPPTGRYTLRVRSADGGEETGATWSATGRGSVRVVGASSLPPSEVVAVDVVADPGGPVALGARTGTGP